MKRLSYALIFILFTAPLCALPAEQKPKAFRPEAAEEMPQPLPFEQLSTSQKLAQTIFVAVDVDKANDYRNAIQKGLVGGILIQWGNYSLEKTKSVIDKMQSWAAKSPSHLPLLVAIDYEGGTVYTPVTLGFPYLPTNMMIAAANNPEDTVTLFYTVANELKNAGVNINFAPVVDVNINPSNPIIGVRSFGSDTQVVSRMGVAVITGMQKAGIMAVAKHFPGHGETYQDSHLALPHLNVSEEEFRRVHLPPFKAAIDSGVMGIMTAHIVYDFMDKGSPATFSPIILKGLLRDELKFKGVVISDSLDMAGAKQDSKEMVAEAVKSYNAGVDILLTGKRDPARTHLEIMTQIEKTISKERIEDAAKRIYELKKRLGLFGLRQQNIDLQSYRQPFNVFAKKITDEGVTVVKAEKGVLPYTKTSNGKKQKLCSVFFSPARFADQLPPIHTPFLKRGWQVEYFNASMRPKRTDIMRAQKCMKDADLVIIGSLQWADKPIDSQKTAIDELLQSNKDIILLSLMSPYDIKFYPQAKNIIAMYGVNKLSAAAAANIITGDLKPQGKLPINLNYEEK